MMRGSLATVVRGVRNLLQPAVRQSIRSLSDFPTTLQAPERGYISITGVDAKKLLQGLVTNDINKLQKGKCQPAAFLSAKGRIVADAMLYEYSPGGEDVRIIVESDTDAVNALLRILKIYKLRSKVTVEIANYKTLVSLSHSASTDADASVTAPDPRLPGLDFSRQLLALPVPEVGDASNIEYRKLYLLHGVASSADILNKIPLECNMDHLHYIDFGKGCYLGQELTARTKYKGLVKKRLLPFVYTRADQNKSAVKVDQKFHFLSEQAIEAFMNCNDFMLSTPISSGNDAEKEESVGSIKFGESAAAAGSVIGPLLFSPSLGCGIGLGMLRLQYVKDQTGDSGGLTFGGGVSSAEADPAFSCTPFRPSWMNDTVLEEIFKGI